jgi:L-histidine Nalpha-methyltransferase
MSTSQFTENRSISAKPYLSQRIRIDHLISSTEPSEEELHPGSDVIQGLTQPQKTLPPRYFYDDRGSQLFEQICDQPEYYLTRTETEILRVCAPKIAQITGTCELIELGSGNSTKTRILLDAYQNAGDDLLYCPIDVSAGILESSAQNLLLDYLSLQVHGLVGTYDQALQKLPPRELPTRMICFIGSSIGNLNPQECDRFLQQIADALKPGEYFLLGIDLQKSKMQLESAYNDAKGVTAEFNLNMLRHLNRRFEGDFDLEQFAHVSTYNQTAHQIEMHLQSLRSQTVQLKALDLTIELAEGETILSEISRKFDLREMQEILTEKRLDPIQVWTDQNNWFGVILAQALSSQSRISP